MNLIKKFNCCRFDNKQDKEMRQMQQYWVQYNPKNKDNQIVLTNTFEQVEYDQFLEKQIRFNEVHLNIDMWEFYQEEMQKIEEDQTLLIYYCQIPNSIKLQQIKHQIKFNKKEEVYWEEFEENILYGSIIQQNQFIPK